ncbi:copper type II ascorbate-dependent monooxygenase [Chytriomyces sp. MP71]|nr:copper type II ascorbate-dependent monooxygenase [Chytriomyces sp. MP71]
MILYGCSGKPAALGDQYDCNSMDSLCSQAALLWAPGAGKTVYPADAGLPIGTGGFKYFALQIHYNNPNSESNVVDSSGFKFYYTSVLRPHDIGLLLIGKFDLNIPGNSPNYTDSGFGICPSACTAKFPSNLIVITNTLHMHTLGYNISTRQIRNNHELVPLGLRHYYDFSYQGVSPPVDPSAVISPGDTLLTRCFFKPTLGVRANPTHWGENTTDEMCLNFITYYPKFNDVDQCYDVGKGHAVCATEEQLNNTTSYSEMLERG